MRKSNKFLLLILIIMSTFMFMSFSHVEASSLYDLKVSNRVKEEKTITFNNYLEIDFIKFASPIVKKDKVEVSNMIIFDYLSFNTTNSETVGGYVYLSTDDGEQKFNSSGKLVDIENYLFKQYVSNIDKFFVDFGYFEREDNVFGGFSNGIRLFNIVKSVENIKLTFIVNNMRDHKPSISGKDMIINNIDTPYTLDKIKSIANLKAIDEVDGDITSKIKIIKDEYSSNMKSIGTWVITYQVTNSFNKSTVYDLIIKNMDLTKPIITGPDTISFGYKEMIDKEDILKNYSYSDNVDENLEISISSDRYEPNKVGEYNFTISAIDESNNQGTKVIVLKLIDNIKPQFIDSNEGVIKINVKDEVTTAILKNGLSAIDEVDGDISNKIEIIEGEVFNKIGTYEIKFQVKDKMNNSVTHTRTFEVIATNTPVFWVSKNLISIEDVNAMTIEQLVSILTSYEKIDIKTTQVLINEYSGNETIPGEYKLSILVVDNEDNEHHIERIIKVFNTKEMEEDQNDVVIYLLSIVIIGGTILIINRLVKRIKKSRR
ncbi:MAG: DUF5011 domain-containing protein [Acholeplasma sp.]|nr:DUF5011 domain-containing protein [Acholeplasma sp.]